MRVDINTWKNMACFYGSVLDLRDERIMGVRQSKDFFELYYRNQQERIRLLYIEVDAYRTFYQMLEQDGWENIMITKYLHPDRQTPHFLLKCTQEGYSVTYQYEIATSIVIQADFLYRGEPCTTFKQVEPHMQDNIKKLHRLVIGYTISRFKNKIMLHHALRNMMEELRIPNKLALDVPMMLNTEVKKAVVLHFRYVIDEMEKSPEHAVSTALAIFRKRFDSTMTRTIVWLTLMELVTQYVEETQENKDEMMSWLNNQYLVAKNELTAQELEELSRNGIQLL